MILNLRHQLRFYMRQHRISAPQLAKELEIPRSTVGDWLSGAAPRDLLKLKKTALFFGVTVDHLLFGAGDVAEKVKHGTSPDTQDLEREILKGIYEVVLRPVRK
jgi:transcriptional regulator with XRE-family HTH domain